jgi:hypothetical protein
VSVFSFRGDYLENTKTDANGRFYLSDGEALDSTVFIVQTDQQSGRRRLELTLDKPSYPERVIPVVYSEPPKLDIFAKYADKAEQKYIDEHGIRMIYLSEVTISAHRKPVHQSIFYTADYTLTEDEIEKLPSTSMRSLLNRLPVTVSQSLGGLTVMISRFGNCPAMFLVDDFLTDEIDWLEVGDVAQVDIIKDDAKLVIWGNRAPCGIISIFTKRGIVNAPRETHYIKHIMPLGFQKPAEFYALKYDTPPYSTKPDMRTTIHWEPNLTTDGEGNASFSFYTADTPSTYTVVIEGVTEDGKIVYKRDRIMVVK